MDSFILLDGGHRVVVYNTSPQELEHELSRPADPIEQEYFYIQNTAHGDNGCVIRPEHIVGIVKRGKDT